MASIVRSYQELERRMKVFKGDIVCIASNGNMARIDTLIEGRYFFIREKDEPIVCSHTLTRPNGMTALAADVDAARDRFRKYHKCYQGQHLTFKRKLPNGEENTICGICGNTL